jgi:hypothetical protein
MAHYIDDLGIEFGIVDEAGIALWIDDLGIFLGGEGAADDPGNSGAPKRLPRGQVYYPDGWHFVR